MAKSRLRVAGAQTPSPGSSQQLVRQGVPFRKAHLNKAAGAGDASRATIWQGNCHVEDQLFYNNITPAQNTIPIQYKQLSRQTNGFLQTALSKAHQGTVFPYIPSLMRFR